MDAVRPTTRTSTLFAVVLIAVLFVGSSSPRHAPAEVTIPVSAIAPRELITAERIHVGPSEAERLYRYDQARERATFDAYHLGGSRPSADVCYADPWATGCR